VGLLFSVAAGGALGAVARYGLGTWIQQLTRSQFPWGTLLINVTGSLALGFLVVWLQARMASVELGAFLMVGVLGGYTTFSTLSYETIALAQGGAMARAAIYAIGSLALGVLAALGGMAIAQQMLRGPA
jgi:CrcB protein